MKDDSPNGMIAQTASLGNLIRDEFDACNERVLKFIPDSDLRKMEHVVIAGCGDSHMSGLATEFAFEQIAGIPTEPFNSLDGGRYNAPFVQPNTIMFAISVGGDKMRTVEVAARFRKFGATTVGVTAHPDSALGKRVNLILDCTIPGHKPSPGVRSYRVSLLMLWLLAIRLGEVRGKLSKQEAAALRAELKATGDA